MEISHNLLLIFGLICIGFVHASNNTNVQPRIAEVVPLIEKDYALESSFVGAVILKTAKLVWTLMSIVWSVAGYKLAALALAAKSLIWLIKNGFSMILGAGLMFGFCKFTGKCSLDYVPQSLIEILPNEELTRAEQNLSAGFIKYQEKSA